MPKARRGRGFVVWFFFFFSFIHSFIYSFAAAKGPFLRDFAKVLCDGRFSGGMAVMYLDPPKMAFRHH